MSGVARVVGQGWLLRAWELEVGGRVVRVEYRGRGLGKESVLVDGAVVAQQHSAFWFAPAFAFEVAGRPASLDVAVGATTTLAWTRLKVDGVVVAEDGVEPA